MKIGVISDTHGDVIAWQQAISGPLAGADIIIHAGDILYHGPRNPLSPGYEPERLAEMLNASAVPILAVRGNCDAAIDLELVHFPVQDPIGFWEFGGLRLLAYHGHQQDLPGPAWARQWGVRVVINGHTHVPRLVEEGGCYWLNPGSPSLPKGPDPRPAVAWLTDAGMAIVDLEGNIIKKISF